MKNALNAKAAVRRLMPLPAAIIIMITIMILTAVLSFAATEDEAEDPWRPHCHFTASSGWINDPNGLVYNSETGEYHMFFQHNQTVKEDVGKKCWGHAVSKDLVHWTELEPAILPDGLGAIWSGSAVIDRDNTSGLFDASTPPGARMVAFFTYYGGNTEKGTEKQGMAYSVDNGRTWIKYDGNPVVYDASVTDGFRDPKVFRVSDGAGGEQWAMLVAGGIARLYTSPDLKNWSFSGVCKDCGGAPIRTECPDLYPLKADDGTEHWVLCCAGRTYYTGSLKAAEGEKLAFSADSGPLTLIEQPTDMYACQTFSDMPNGRRVGIYWLIDNTMQSADSTGRFPGKNWDGAESLPVEFSLVKQSDGYRLSVSPAAEVYGLLGEDPLWTAGDGRPVTVTEDGLELYRDGDCASVYVKLRFRGAGASRMAIEILKRGDENTTLNYSFSGERITVVRSGRTAAFPRDNMFMNSPPDEEGIVTLELFIDRSAVAIYDGQGHTAQGLVFTSGTGKAGLALFTRMGNAELLSAEIRKLPDLRAGQEATPENIAGNGGNESGNAKTHRGLTAGITAAIITAIVLLVAGVAAAVIILNKKH